jgi:D-glycero-alpha-D-manno-heptose-7-phosphate kinase
MIINVKTPTRIDFAGGTVDVGILYLLHDNPITINCAINIFSKVKLEKRNDTKIIIESKDLDEKLVFNSIKELTHNNKLSLITKVIEFYQPDFGFSLITDCESPLGAGLAGSSALNIALNGMFNKICNKNFDKLQLIQIAKNIETKVLAVPTGYQDYYPEMFGGVNIVNFNTQKVFNELIDIPINELEDRMILVYTGKPHKSGVNNWELVKKHIDGDKKTVESFKKIVKISKDMKNAILNKNYDMIGTLLDKEWQVRKNISKKWTTDKIESLIEISKKNGATGGRACGAGGGGCVLIFTKQNMKKNVISAIKKDYQILDFKIEKKGMQIV